MPLETPLSTEKVENSSGEPNRKLWIFAGIVAIILAVFLYVRFHKPADNNGTTANAASTKGSGGRGGAAGARVPVAVTPVVARDFPIFLTGLGSVTAYNTVTVKSRVDGQIVQVNFREGQDVKAGQVLLVVDPRPYEALLHQTEANLAKDQAALADAQTNLARFQELFNQKVIAKQQLDTQRAQVGELEGTIGADKAQVENARLQVAYTKVTAPISGRVGLRMVDMGNIVHANDQNGLLVITQVQPISALFTLPEDKIPQVVARMHAGGLPVDAYDRDDKTKIASGKLETIDNQIDPTTGTVRLKAVFDNRDGALWPNQFVNIHLELQVLKSATVMPSSAVQHGQQGTFVFTVDPNNTAQMRNVQVKLTQGDSAVIDTGVNPGDRVVTDGQDRLQNGMKVEPASGQSGGGRNRNAQAQGATPDASQQPPANAGDGSQGQHGPRGSGEHGSGRGNRPRGNGSGAR